MTRPMTDRPQWTVRAAVDLPSWRTGAPSETDEAPTIHCTGTSEASGSGRGLCASRLLERPVGGGLLVEASRRWISPLKRWLPQPDCPF